MNCTTEQKFLKELLAKKKKGISPLIISPFFLPVVWILMGAAFFVAFRLSDKLGSTSIMVVALSAFAGLVGGAAYFFNLSAKQCPVIDKYIQEESVDSRIRELERT